MEETNSVVEESEVYTCATSCPCYKTDGMHSRCKLGFFSSEDVVDYKGDRRPCAPGAKA